jgi:hypothetical protein|tara:strand:+ start:1175 stop:1684 length:510 start_codon:yes stop_codon:yes gene_type:complete
MYFKDFPVILYDSKEVTNLLRRVAIRSKVKTNVMFFDTYDVKEGETPEMIADKLYDDPQLHWVVMIVNNITDRYHEWPMSGNQFLDYVNEKYSNPEGTHHYEIEQSSGDTTVKINIGTDNTDHPTATLITNYEYEEEEQNRRRKIRLLDPKFIQDFTAEFSDLMQESII